MQVSGSSWAFNRNSGIEPESISIESDNDSITGER